MEAYDWNCRQHIPQLFSRDAVADTLTALRDRITALESQLAYYRARAEPPTPGN